MPINIPDDLPARRTLEQEGVEVIRQHDATRQDIRPMRIALLNLMPRKVQTETQLARLIGSTPLQVELTLLTTSSYTPTNTPATHMAAFYKDWAEVSHQKFDGLIITGAPVEELPFEEVLYWSELTDILDWSRENATSALNICWGGQAALYHYYGIPKYPLAQKMFGVFPHRVVAPAAALMRGFDDSFPVPVSRHTENRRADIDRVASLEVLAESDESGLCLVYDQALNQAFMFNHLEYDAGTLEAEYRRDLESPRGIELPAHYFPDDDPSKPPANSWRSHGHLLFANWINALYQQTPYEVSQIGRHRAAAPAKKPKAAAAE